MRFVNRADKRAAERKEKTGYETSGRPKKWKQKCFEVVKESVTNRYFKSESRSHTLILCSYLCKN